MMRCAGAPGKGFAALLCSGALLAACDEAPPTGQVLAVVDGTEVTRREVREELPLALQGAAEEQGARLNQALDAVVDRKLLADAARSEGLETDPDYHFALRRAREQLLVEALMRKRAAEAANPTPAEIAAYMAARSWQFAERHQIELAPVDGRAARSAIDTADFAAPPPDWVHSARVGNVLKIAGRDWRVGAVSPVSEPPADSAARAAADMRRSQLDAKMDNALKTLRKKVVIRYQAGFGPGGR